AKKLKANINLFNTDAVNFLQKTSMCFDVFYIDPPYNSDLYDKTLFVISVKNLLTSDGVVILEKPIDKEVNTNGFNIVKEKKYGDKVVCYLSKQK
ncbi:MAG: RsmD family RNA methyltransferase, partial [Candidatus Gastranaerophilaceae bacterium]